MLVLEINQLSLQAVDKGSVFRWIGPSLRGAYGKAFKDSVCQIEVPQRPERCRGCDFMWRCGYGQSVEPDMPPGAPVIRGRSSPPPAVVISQQDFNGVTVTDGLQSLESGACLPLRAIFFGPAVRYAEEILSNLSRTVSHLGVQTGMSNESSRRCRFTLNREHQAQHVRQLLVKDLPSEGCGRTIPSLRVELTAPLRLTGKNDEIIREPTLIDLFRASARIVESSLTAFGAASQFDFRPLNSLAESVARTQGLFRPFRQKCLRDRGRAMEQFEAVTGWVEFESVPLSLIPWLYWGGRLHVGERRTAGAGSWRLQL